MKSIKFFLIYSSFVLGTMSCCKLYAEEGVSRLEMAVRETLDINQDVASAVFRVDQKYLQHGPFIEEFANLTVSIQQCLQQLYLQGRSSTALFTCSVIDDFNSFMNIQGGEKKKGSSPSLTAGQKVAAQELSSRLFATLSAINAIMERLP